MPLTNQLTIDNNEQLTELLTVSCALYRPDFDDVLNANSSIIY